jgi:glycosyltransferase involved in cell wall biosynthesis
MIWLSSFPRSGNTFLRNVLVEVYGLPSSSYYNHVGEPENYQDFPFVKTHELPDQIIPSGLETPSVYLIRDGRDSLVSMVHQQIDIYGVNRPFEDIFIEATLAAEGSYFGGWSANVAAWLAVNPLVIRFETLIQNPLEQAQRLQALMHLPTPNPEKLPTFEALKFGQPQYGRGKRIATSEEEELAIVRKSFRRGKAFGWKDELSRELQNLFWTYHRKQMEELGYRREGGLEPLNPDFDYRIMALLGEALPAAPARPYRVLIEANKLLMHRNDGVKRYLLELLKALYPVVLNPQSRWQIDTYIKGKIVPLQLLGHELFDSAQQENRDGTWEMRRNWAKQAVRSSFSHLKRMVPVSIKEPIKNHYRRGLMKLGLRFSTSAARISWYKGWARVTWGGPKPEKPMVLQADHGYDLIHVPLPQHFEPFQGIPGRYLVTVHDLTHRLFSQFHTEGNIDKAERGFQFFEAQNAHYLCISKCTQTDLEAAFPGTAARSAVVYEAADYQKFKPDYYQRPDPLIRKMYGIPEGRFLLTLSTLEPRKNLKNTIAAFDLLLDEHPNLECTLVIAGKMGWKSKELLQFRHRKNIVFTQFILEQDLPGLLNEAEALCYVSYYEGFGLPPLEAMSCKTPVIYGDNSSMKELFEGHGLAANPDQPEDIANQMKRILLDPDFKREMEERSLEKSFEFSWRKTAMETIGLYEKTIQSKTTSA